MSATVYVTNIMSVSRTLIYVCVELLYMCVTNLINVCHKLYTDWHHCTCASTLCVSAIVYATNIMSVSQTYIYVHHELDICVSRTPYMCVTNSKLTGIAAHAHDRYVCEELYILRTSCLCHEHLHMLYHELHVCVSPIVCMCITDWPRCM